MARRLKQRSVINAKELEQINKLRFASKVDQVAMLFNIVYHNIAQNPKLQDDVQAITDEEMYLLKPSKLYFSPPPLIFIESNCKLGVCIM